MTVRRVLLIDGPGQGMVVESDGPVVCYAGSAPFDPFDLDAMSPIDVSRQIVTYEVHRVRKYDWEMWIGTCRAYDDRYLDALNEMNFSELIGRGLLRKRIASGPNYGGCGGVGAPDPGGGGGGGAGGCAYIGPAEGRPPYNPGGVVPQFTPGPRGRRCVGGCRYWHEGFNICEAGECVYDH